MGFTISPSRPFLYKVIDDKHFSLHLNLRGIVWQAWVNQNSQRNANQMARSYRENGRGKYSKEDLSWQTKREEKLKDSRRDAEEDLRESEDK